MARPPFRDPFADVLELFANGPGNVDELEFARRMGYLPTEAELDLKQAPRFDLGLTPSSAEFQTFVTDRLLPELLATVSCRDMREKAAGAALNVIIANLAHTAFNIRTTLYTRFPRSHGGIKSKSRYNPSGVGDHVFVKVVDGLIELGHLEHIRGFEDKERGRRKESRIRLDVDFRLRLLTQIESDVQVGQRHDTETIVLKDDCKALVEYDDNTFTRRIRRELADYNAFLAGRRINLEMDNQTVSNWRAQHLIDFSRYRYHRVFNQSSFDLGGRFYGPWWQLCPSRVRQHITIDACPVVELDYSAMNVHLAYGKLGLRVFDFFDPEGDVYEVPGFETLDRQVRKNAVLMLFSTRSRHEAHGVIYKKAREHGAYLDNEEVSRLLDASEARHEAIRPLFYTSSGLELMRMESMVSEIVIEKAMAMEIPILNIHDGCVVPGWADVAVKEAMEEAFSELGWVSIPKVH